MIAPFSLVIFGATGDLTQKKLLPAFYNLYKEGFLPKEFLIIGFSRRNINILDFHKLLYQSISEKSGFKESVWQEFVKNIVFVSGQFEDRSAYKKLKETLSDYDKKIKRVSNKMLYLATPPEYYQMILDNIHASTLSSAKENAWVRVLIEKPFGRDLQTAVLLDKKLSVFFKEEQIYRIDHYLGKETVQNIIAFRFANGIFEPVWNNNYIDHVQITLSETGGIGTRGNFYEGVGALRDVTQNHLLQVMAKVTMESPRSFSDKGMRDARSEAIKALRYIEPSEVSKFVVRGQYNSYRTEKNVAPNSTTETFVAMKLFVDTPRFKGVPFYVRSGKKLKKNIVEISLVFKQVCHLLFKEVGCPEEGNVLTIRIQPEEGISTRFIAKEPGLSMKLTPIDMHFSYKEAFKTQETDAYERIVRDAFLGDQMLFNRSDELVYSWAFISKIQEGWKKQKPKFPNYNDGSWGPKEAIELIEKDKRRWIIK